MTAAASRAGFGQTCAGGSSSGGSVRSSGAGLGLSLFLAGGGVAVAAAGGGASAAASLQQQADQLVKAVSVFRLKN